MSQTEKAKKKQLPRYRGHSRLMKAGNGGSLSIPSEMMSALPNDLLFKPEFTKDGILFRVVDESKLVTEEKALPAWIKKATPATKPRNNSKAKPAAKADTDTEHAGPIPPVDDEHPDSDGSDEAEGDIEAHDEVAPVDTEEGDFEPPVSDDDSPF